MGAAALDALLPKLPGLIREHAAFFVANRATFGNAVLRGLIRTENRGPPVHAGGSSCWNSRTAIT